VWAYSLNTSTGALTKTPDSPFPAQNIAHGVAVTPNNAFAYVANAGANTVSGYVITPATGDLIPVPGSPFATGSSPHAVAVDPTGKFLYVPNMFSSDISAYTINQATGALTPIPGSPFASAPGRLGFSIAIDPTGAYLYAPNIDSGAVSGYAINATTGALTTLPGSPFSAGSQPNWVTVHPNGHFLYANDVSSVNAFQINLSTGALTLVAGSPFAAGNGGRSLAVDPQGRFVYAVNSSDYTVTGFAVNPSGSLTQVPGSPYAVGWYPDVAIVDPSSQFLYVANANGNTVSGFQINQSTGALVQIAGSPFPSGSEPLYFAFATPAVTSQLSVQYVQPTQGGNSGSVTIEIVGNGFQNGATVMLTGTGPSISASYTNVGNSSSLAATFNLTGVPVGARNIVIRNPDTTSITLPNAFTVQQGGAPQLWAQLTGRDKIRIGVPQTFYINYGNLGTTDALGTRLMANVPTSVAPNLTLGNSNGVVTMADQGATTLITINLGRVPAGSTSFVPVTLTADASQAPFQVQITISGR
jgi:6-phosphogluconolactonase (cycloisomerase 2 family)